MPNAGPALFTFHHDSGACGPRIIAQLTGSPGGIGTYVVDRAQVAGATATGLAIGGLDPELDNLDIQN